MGLNKDGFMKGMRKLQRKGMSKNNAFKVLNALSHKNAVIRKNRNRARPGYVYLFENRKTGKIVAVSGRNPAIRRYRK